ncbi:hypothetical protein [Cyanothece sp. BG0011]|uniref:hypothetical protein n=1 Tax=Cyanothece sp. BG0011 TaxID=2082950 RepID=UPI001300AC84|nr:hypothetical protein [Cyanothece sp. BG0011]
MGKKTFFLELIFTLLINNQTTLFRGINKDFHVATIEFSNGDVVDYHFKDHQVVASKDVSLKCYLFLPLSINYVSPLINVPFETKMEKSVIIMNS